MTGAFIIISPSSAIRRPKTGIRRSGGERGGIQSAMGLQLQQGINSSNVDFEEYAAKAKTLPVNTTNKSKLILYYLGFVITPLDADELKLRNKNNLAWLRCSQHQSKDHAGLGSYPKGKQGPMTPLSDQITIHAP
ncbi:hypothetical protein C4D60_Mb01t11520 [Musa balbisiana]|uniref:Uncharacterized protein n=1 Tax=Musa balbisiana TaxID=52838 RepID=A0A4S8JMU0_MUSBA|nr:hypothetical protein C4D60_Mb01t11520 [Musa balbisiana]